MDHYLETLVSFSQTAYSQVAGSVQTFYSQVADSSQMAQLSLWSSQGIDSGLSYYQGLKASHQPVLDSYLQGVDKYDIVMALVMGLCLAMIAHLALFLVCRVFSGLKTLCCAHGRSKFYQKYISCQSMDRDMQLYLKDHGRRLDRKSVKKIFKLQEIGVRSGKLMEKQNNLLQKDLALMEHRQMSGVRYMAETEQVEENAGLSKDYMY